jgi:hypothetical protein
MKEENWFLGLSIVFFLFSVGGLTVKRELKPHCDCKAAGCYVVNGSSTDILASWKELQMSFVESGTVGDKLSAYVNKIGAHTSCPPAGQVVWSSVTLKSGTKSTSISSNDTAFVINVDGSFEVTGNVTFDSDQLNVTDIVSEKPLTGTNFSCTAVPLNLRSDTLNAAIIQANGMTLTGSMNTMSVETTSEGLSLKVSTEQLDSSLLPASSSPHMLSISPLLQNPSLQLPGIGPLMPLDSLQYPVVPLNALVTKITIPIKDAKQWTGRLMLAGGYVKSQMLQDEPMMQTVYEGKNPICFDGVA